MSTKEGLTAVDLRQVVLFAALIYLAITFINAIAGIVLLFSLIALITLVLNPLVGWLEKYKVPRQLSALIIALLILGAIALIISLVVPLAAVQLADLIEDLPVLLSQAQAWLVERAQVLGIAIAELDPAEIVEFLAARAGPILARIGTYTLGAFSVLVSIFIVFISVIFTLAKPRPLVEGFLRLFRPEQGVKVASILQQVAIQIRRWTIATIIRMVGVSILTWLVLGPILGLPFAFLFAVIAGLLEVVPIVGPIAAAIPPVLVALAVDPLLALWVILAFIIIQQIESNVLFPLIMGEGLKLHPVSVLFSVMVMGGLFGIVGVFLAVPATAVVKVVVEQLYPPLTEERMREISERVEEIVTGEMNDQE